MLIRIPIANPVTKRIMNIVSIALPFVIVKPFFGTWLGRNNFIILVLRVIVNTGNDAIFRNI